MTQYKNLLACWRSGQIDPAEMVRLCRADPALEAALRETERD
jgi:hypothetical protein